MSLIVICSKALRGRTKMTKQLEGFIEALDKLSRLSKIASERNEYDELKKNQRHEYYEASARGVIMASEFVLSEGEHSLLRHYNNFNVRIY